MPSDVRDKPYSWVVAMNGCLMYFIMNGMSRTTGLLFVETLDIFDTDRETASFPFILASALRYVTGPIAGALAGRVGTQSVILFGCIMACIGVGGCYFATTVTAISVLWGGLFGLGSGTSLTQIPQLINLYFTKHLTTANGITHAGTAIAGFVLPPIMESLLNEYGIAGTYLLLSGIALHAIPAAILLKEPDTEKLPMISFEIPEEIRGNYRRRVSNLSIIYDNTKRRASRINQRYAPDILRGVTSQTTNGDITEIRGSDKRESFSNTNKSIYSSNSSRGNTFRGKSNSFSFGENILQNTSQGKYIVNANIQNILPSKTNMTAFLSEIKEGKPLEIKNTVIITDELVIACPGNQSLKGNVQSFSHPKVAESLSDITENELLETKDIRRASYSSEPKFPIISCHPSICSRGSYVTGAESFTYSKRKNKVGVFHIESTEVTKDPENPEQPPNMCLSDISIFWDIKFFLISFTGSMNGFHCFVLSTILIDFCMDKGISTTDATYIMMAFSIFDMVGRVGFGWVTDGKYMTRANLCAVTFFVMTASLAFFVLSTGLIPMFIILSLLGLSLGVHSPVPSGLISEYIETSKHTMANASFNVLGVPFLLFTPAMIGYFRDGIGSYDLFVYLLCFISFVCALMMLLLPYIQRREQEKKSTALN